MKRPSLKTISLFPFLFLFAEISHSQAPDVQWQNTIGGAGDDNFNSVIQTSDGGYMVGGYSISTNTGDKTEIGNGSYDYWVLKLNAYGNIIWQNTIGGSSDDKLKTVIQTPDGGYILGGYSGSGISGDKTENVIGSNDFWIVKIDDVGNLEWQQTIGGSSTEYLYAFKSTSDGGYILGGYSASGISGDKTEPSYGEDDFWIVKIDSLGNVQWDKTYGGNLDDHLFDINETADHGYILGGFSQSGISGNKTLSNLGGQDYWVIKTDSIGNIEWQNAYGGNFDDIMTSVLQTAEGGYIVAGYSSSGISGNKTEATIGILGLSDYWILKLNATGDIQWQNTIGGDSYDWPSKVFQSVDGRYIVGGVSYSPASGDKTEDAISSDYWILKLSVTGNILWQDDLGGDWFDSFSDIIQTADNGFLVGGTSWSGISGDKTEAAVGYGYPDYWILKLYPEECVAINYYQDADGDGFGNDLISIADCVLPYGYVEDNTDCDDTNPLIHPDADELCNGTDDNCNLLIDEGLPSTTYYLDFDGDGFGNPLISISTCDISPVGYVTDNTDCNDLNPMMNPGIIEICNGLDDNCNLLIDEGLTATTYYLDADADGFGNFLFPFVTCSGFAPTGFVTDSTDCDDSNSLINPSALEICNELDDNCNLLIDEGFPSFTYYLDADGDGFGNILIPLSTCSDIPPAGYVADNTDCDDLNNLIHEPIGFYADADGDLYGDISSILFICSLTPPAGYVTDSTDCDDTNMFVNPVSNELCNGQDDNCNEIIDEGLSTHSLYLDADDDNYGDPVEDTVTCATGLIGYVSDSTDCDDTNPLIYPGAPELLNGYDDNCNDLIDEGLGVEDVSILQFIIYPVPATNQLTIVFNKIFNGDVEIYNVMGEIMLQHKIIQSNQTELHISDLPPGNYLIRFIDTDLNSGSQLFTKLSPG